LPSHDSILKKHSLVISGHHTSVTLENIFWDQFKAIARLRGQSLSLLAAEIDAQRARDHAEGNLSSALRVFVLKNSI